MKLRLDDTRKGYQMMNNQYRFVKYVEEDGTVFLYSVQYLDDVTTKWHSLITDYQYTFVRNYCMSRFLFDTFPDRSSSEWIRKELAK